ncbi:MAG: TonB-dependent receptor [bacterium]
MKPTQILVLIVTLGVSNLAIAQGSEQVSVSGFVFGEEGLQVEAIVTICGTRIQSDAQGSVTVTAAPGPCELVYGEQTASVELISGTSIEVMFRPDGIEIEGATSQSTQEPEDVAVEAVPVSGQVVSLEGKPIRDARIFVRGLDVEAQSDATGAFKLSLAVGEHEISVVHPDFSAQNVVVQVSRTNTNPVRIELTPSAVQLEDFTVTAPRIEGGQIEVLTERRDSAQVTEVLGAEQMSKSGASDAADALSRVTGITLVGGKYVYVRGLGDRYSSTLLNRSYLPSPEPEKRVVPLDMFPTDVLESVLVQKNFSPDMPGEFGGGVVELRTRRFPSEFEASVGISVGARTGSTGQTVPWNQGGSLDFLGIDDGTRGLPDKVRAASEDSPLLPGDRFSVFGYSEAELESLGESFPNTWEQTTRTLPPNAGMDVSLGDRIELGEAVTGYRVGLTWSQDFALEESKKTYYVVGANGLESRNQYDFTTAAREVVLGGIFTTGLEIGRQKLTLTSLLDRITSDETRLYSGFNRDAGADIRVTRFRWVERTLAFEQLLGEHQFDDFTLGWHYSFALALRAEPDRREYRYDARDGRYRLSDRPEGNSRVYSDLVDSTHDVALDVTVPFQNWLGESSVKSGLSAVLKDREVDTRRYKYQGDGLSDVFYQEPEDLFVPENIGPDAPLQFRESTRSTDNYVADQQILAAYSMVELPLLSALTMSAGVRLEYSSQSVETFELFNPDGERVPADLQTLDPLPALALTYTLNPQHILRFATSRTVSRPDFRELSPLLFADVAGGRAVQGNPDLNRALITHADLRYEFYPAPQENISVGGFAKLFDAPIESELQAGAQPLLTFQNADSAVNVGAEVEVRKSFGMFTPLLEDVYLGGNFSLIYSRVSLAPGGNQTNAERPLQGQSPYVVNANVGYDNPDRGISASLLYNVVGRRIDSVGSAGAPDVYQEAVHGLDFVYRQKVAGHWNLGFKASNLLDPSVEITQGGKVAESYSMGRKVSASVGYDW